MGGFLRAMAVTIGHVLRDRVAVTTMIVASIIYAFYYPAAYQHQVATRLPVVVVDLDRSPSSRDLVRKLEAVRDVQVVAFASSVDEAEASVQRGRADGVLVIDPQFERDILRGGQGRLTFLASGSLLGRATTVMQGLSLAVAGFSREAAMTQARFEGAPVADAIKLVQRPLFNTREGYASAVVTGVAVLIVQQTLLTGMVLILGTLRERRGERLALSAVSLGGVLAAFCLLGTFNMLFYSGFVFWFQDFPRGGNLVGVLLGAVLFGAAVSAFGAFVGSFFRIREHAMQLVLMTSMPLYFLSGLSWPRDSMPAWITWFADLLPSTSGIPAMVKLNQMGATVAEALPELGKLLALAVLYGALAALRYRPRPGERDAFHLLDSRT